MTFTRKDYLDHRCSHDEYYAQFITDGIVRRVAASIGEDRLRASSDRWLNNTPLSRWDAVAAYIIQPDPHVRAMFKSADDRYSIAGGVCIAKAAARRWLQTQ